jgi:hypothetical protein
VYRSASERAKKIRRLAPPTIVVQVNSAKVVTQSANLNLRWGSRGYAFYEIRRGGNMFPNETTGLGPTF